MIKIGVILPSVDVQRTEHLDLRAAARYAEEAGLDSIWMGDHLATGQATLEATIGLATAAAVTERVAIGVSVFVPAIRPGGATSRGDAAEFSMARAIPMAKSL